MDLCDKIMMYENGEMEKDQIIELFQQLINSGRILQGHYGRMASLLIKAGFCHEKEIKH